VSPYLAARHVCTEAGPRPPAQVAGDVIRSKRLRRARDDQARDNASDLGSLSDSTIHHTSRHVLQEYEEVAESGTHRLSSGTLESARLAPAA